MKKYISLAALVSAAAMSTTAYATDIDLSMSDLAVGATNTDTLATDLSKFFNGTVYDFDGNSALLNIKNTALSNYISAGSGYLTVAAWVYAESITEKSVFSFGGQENGVKFALKDGKMQFTTKNVADKNVEEFDVIQTNDWTLVAWSLDLSKSKDSSVFVNNTSTNISVGTWNAPDPFTFGIGSGNSNSLRDQFNGFIANLTVFSSDSLATYDDITGAVGAVAPIVVNNSYTWNGGNSGVWDTTTANWLVGEKSSVYNNPTNEYVAERTSVTFDTAASVEIKEAITAGSVTISENTTFTGPGVLSANIIIEDGKTLTIDGGLGTSHTYTLQGGTLINNVLKDFGAAQIAAGTAITLTADSTIEANKDFGMIASGHAKNTLDLGGYTLTKTGTADFWLSNTKITEGTFEIAKGAVVLTNNNNGGMDGSAATFKIHAGSGQLNLSGQSTCSLTVAGMTILLGEANTTKPAIAGAQNGTLTILNNKITLGQAEAFVLDGILDETRSYYLVDSRAAWDDTWTTENFTLDGDWGSWEITDYNNTTGLLTLTAVPEPSAFGLLAGLGALALVASRRRRK